jgi:predicted DNA-binding protein with PD1-like motif
LDDSGFGFLELREHRVGKGKVMKSTPIVHKREVSASLTAIGAFAEATVGWFDIAAKSHRKNGFRSRARF